MRVLFLNPPVVRGVQERAPDRNFGCNYGIYFQHPIHILYPATFLKENGHEVTFIDAPVEGLEREDVEGIVKEKEFDAYVFFTVFLAQKLDLWWARRIREIDKRARIIFTGPEPSYRIGEFLIDNKTFVVRGEVEKTLLELVNALEKGQELDKIKGLSYRADGKIRNNPPRPPMSSKELDELPIPDRRLIRAPERYYNVKLKGRPTTTMLTSRGCSYRCIFCIPSAYSFAREIEFKLHHNFVKPPVALRSAESVVREFREIKRLGYRSVAVMDDNFIWGKKRVEEIAEGIKNLGIEWGCLARANFLQDMEMLEKMKEAGCSYIDIGVESFNQKVLDYIRKDLKVEEIFKAIENLKEVGIEPKINILLGASPLQTKEDIKRTVEILKRLDVETVSFSIVIPHPMTEFYRIVKKEGWFATKNKDFKPADPYREGIVNFPEMSHEELEKMVRWAYRSFYLRPSYILKKLRKIKSPREFLEHAELL